MSIQIYILSKLMQGDNYPYKLKKELSAPIPFDKLGNLTESKLYYHFETLKKQGFIETTRVIKEEHRPDKNIFSITVKGRKQLPLKIYEVFEKSHRVEEMMIGLFFLEHVDKARIVAIVEGKLAALQAKSEGLSLMYPHVISQGKKREMIEFVDGYFTEKRNREMSWMSELIAKLKSEIS